jgi:hypothetical protein
MKIIFEQKKINNGTVKISLDGGVTYEEYQIADVLESGISLKEDQNLSLIKIKGPANILQSAEVVSSIKVGDMRGIIFAGGVASSSNLYKDLTTIDIKNGVTDIGNNAFTGCSSLINVSIPNSVINIGNYAFNSCMKLTNVTIPEGVISIGEYAFCGCNSITNIEIPNSVTTIATYAFRNCMGLTNVNILDGLTTISRGTFYNCSKLTSITIPVSITSIEMDAFRNCPNLIINYAGTQEQWNTISKNDLWNRDSENIVINYNYQG